MKYAGDSMNRMINQTHNPNVRSWVASANEPDTDFPIQNLPFGVFQRPGQAHDPCIGVAIGDQVLDLALCYQTGLLSNLPEAVQRACCAPILNPLMALGNGTAAIVRDVLHELLRADQSTSILESSLLVPMAEVEMLLPATIGDYTDFYASLFHATNVGKLFRPDHPLLPNYKYVPIAYHGRSSSIVSSRTSIKRPQGQIKEPQDERPRFALSQSLDYEVEVGFFIGAGNSQGSPVAIAEAEASIFGLCLVNDWSARDLQAWEYQPLGPFLGKNFATTISPWVVTLEALAPFRCPAFPRSPGDPTPLHYLTSKEDATQGGIDLTVEVWLQSLQMKEQRIEPMRLSQANVQDLYWSPAQMVTHHTSNGCNLRTGDLIASGTVSGKTEGMQGSLLEITRRGTQLIQLPSGEERAFLADGDEVILRGYCHLSGYARIGFGDCRGQILPQ
jgi:fumarylacetoacetase